VSLTNRAYNSAPASFMIGEFSSNATGSGSPTASSAATSQIIACPDISATASSRPVGSKARSTITSSLLLSVATSRPVAVSHNSTDISSWLTANRLRSGEMAMIDAASCVMGKVLLDSALSPGDQA